VVARRNGVAPNLLYRWRRLMLEGGSVAVYRRRLRLPATSWSDRWKTASASLSAQLGRKTLEVEILKEALDKARPKKPDVACASLVKDGGR
jgi:transposase